MGENLIEKIDRYEKALAAIDASYSPPSLYLKSFLVVDLIGFISCVTSICHRE